MGTPDRTESEIAKPFVFPDITDQKVLVLGLGGGCDIITAYAISTLLDAERSRGLVYANTKNGNVGPIEHVTANIVRLCGPVIEPGRSVRGLGKARIDHGIPRNATGSPWIVLLTDEVAEQNLVGEIQSLRFDLIIGVDTGGDSIASKGGRGHKGRDQRMLRVLRQTGVRLLHVVVAPGSDGEESTEDLRTAMRSRIAAGRYRGCFSLNPILPVFRSLSSDLRPTRTPRIVLAAADGLLATSGDGELIVPRSRQPVVPAHWLTTGFVFTPEE